MDSQQQQRDCTAQDKIGPNRRDDHSGEYGEGCCDVLMQCTLDSRVTVSVYCELRCSVHPTERVRLSE